MLGCGEVGKVWESLLSVGKVRGKCGGCGKVR